MARAHAFYLPILLLLALLFTACTSAGGTSGASSSSASAARDPRIGAGCMIGGCSAQLCLPEGSDGMSNCEWKAEYACYKTAICERQADGVCGWTPSNELRICLDAAATASR